MIFLTSDWHVHNYPQFSKPWSPGLNTRARDIYEIVGKKIPELLLQKYQPKVLAYLGDFNFFASNDYRLENLTRRAINKCASTVKCTVVCSGNHDTVGTDSADHNGRLYLPHANWAPFVYREFQSQTSCLFYPIGYNHPMPTAKDLLLVGAAKVDHVIVLMHKNIEHGIASSGFIYSSAKEVKIRNLLEIKKEIPSIMYFGGHYHDHQIIRKLVCIVGAPVQHRRSDENLNRGVVLFNPEDKSIRKITLKTGPQFISTDVDHLEAYSKSPQNHYITVKVVDEVQKRTAFEWIRDTKVNAKVKELDHDELVAGGFEEEEEEVKEVSDAELLDTWLQMKAPDLTLRQRGELVKVAEAL